MTKREVCRSFFGLSNQRNLGYCRKKLLREETLAFTSFLVPSDKGLFPKSYFHLKSAKVYFREISKDKESNVYVMKYVYSSSMTTTLSNYVTTSIFMEDSKESFKKQRNS